MPKYLLRVNYTLEGVRGVLAKGGAARKAAAAAAAKSAGGKVESFYFAFGDTDVYVVADMPDNASAAALALTVSGGFRRGVPVGVAPALGCPPLEPFFSDRERGVRPLCTLLPCA